MPTLILGDIHGSTFWKTAVAENPDCRYVFLGDYLDGKNPAENLENLDELNAELANLQEIIKFKKYNPQNVILLLGNHDLLHLEYETNEKVSRVFRENRSLFQNAFQIDNIIFTHSGFIQRWFVEDFGGDLTRNIAEQLNNPTAEQYDALLQFGNQTVRSGIFMAGIVELYYPLQNFVQIVGHNQVPDIKDVSINGGRIIFCDCLWNGHYLKI
jgi:hypothetical protein